VVVQVVAVMVSQRQTIPPVRHLAAAAAQVVAVSVTRLTVAVVVTQLLSTVVPEQLPITLLVVPVLQRHWVMPVAVVVVVAVATQVLTYHSVVQVAHTVPVVAVVAAVTSWPLQVPVVLATHWLSGSDNRTKNYIDSYIVSIKLALLTGAYQKHRIFVALHL
jgi:hypothetical protein